MTTAERIAELECKVRKLEERVAALEAQHETRIEPIPSYPQNISGTTDAPLPRQVNVTCVAPN